MAYRSIDGLLLLLLVALLLTRWKWLLAAVAVFGAGVLLMSTNAQGAGFPLSVVLCLLMADSVSQRQGAALAPLARWPLVCYWQPARPWTRSPWFRRSARSTRRRQEQDGFCRPT